MEPARDLDKQESDDSNDKHHQAYSLYRKVADLGYDCEIINYINDAVEKRETPLGLKDCTSPRNIAYYFLWEPKLRKKIRICRI